MLAATAVTSLARRDYVSEAKLQVQVGRDSMAVDPIASIGPFVGVADSREMEIQAIEELILSRKVLGSVVDAIGIDSILGPEKWYANQPWLDQINLNPFKVLDRRDKAITLLGRFLEIEIPRNSKIITLSFETDDPKLAQQTLQELIKYTVEEHLKVNRNDESQQFFETEAAALHKKVMTLEDDLSREKEQTGISSVERQRGLMLEQISSYKNEISHLSARCYSLSKEIGTRQQQLSSMAKMQTKAEVTGSASTPEHEMRVELFRLELREKELAAKYNDKNDQLVQVREQLKLARDMLNKEAATKEVTQGVNEERERYEIATYERQADLVENEARLEQLKVDLIALQDALGLLDKKAKRINDMERELQLADLAYRKYKDSLENTRIDRQRREQGISNIRELQAPSFSNQPKDIIKRNLAVGLLLASLLSCGTVALAERSRRSAIVAQAYAPGTIPVSMGAVPNVLSAESSRTGRRETISVTART
jgi:polysaccharide biosynthesis protein PslE